MSQYTDVATINQTVARARDEGLGIPETALRRWVRDGSVPAVYAGKKALIYWPSLLAFLGGGKPQGGAE